jgi:NADPH-dependent F420 reductase
MDLHIARTLILPLPKEKNAQTIMNTKQTVAIIGASGNMGAAIAKSLCKGNYRLLLYTQTPDKIQYLINEIYAAHPLAEVESISCSMQASWEADIIISAVPYSAEKNIAEKIKEVANQKIVVSIANPLNNTFDALLTTPDSSAAEELQQLLPNAKVVKAFNTTFASTFLSPVINKKKIDTFIAGNDEEALETVSALATTIGFNPVVAGNLSVSRTLENMQLLLIRLCVKYNYNWYAGWKILHN